MVGDNKTKQFLDFKCNPFPGFPIHITGKMINLLIFLVLSMMWASSLYSKTYPFLVLILGVLVIFTLGYISIEQTRHIEQSGENISHLCLDSPFNNPAKADQLSENGEHWS